jgi:hypothetical protein
MMVTDSKVVETNRLELQTKDDTGTAITRFALMDCSGLLLQMIDSPGPDDGHRRLP